MIRCKECGTPVGTGRAVGGDLVACADCLARAGLATEKQAKRLVQTQMSETKASRGKNTRTFFGR